MPTPAITASTDQLSMRHCFPSSIYHCRKRILLAVVLLSYGCACHQPDCASSGLKSLKRLDHFAVHVKNLQTSEEFYRRVFGFHVINKWTTTWMVGNDYIRVGLFQRPQAAAVDDPDNKLIIEHVAFLTDEAGFGVVLKELDQLGVPHEPAEDTGIAKSVFFHDPDGHLLEITYYYKDRPAG